ncbi:hypothetical protein GGR57DRAFT_470408 [Xylariaceae sp. FL1272]|nr:hypothetical protein GGR57DRAFT_470408 [Xylariaceae sp. FL1272]
MAPYTFKVLDSPATTMSPSSLAALHDSLRAVGSECLTPLPTYQVFMADISDAFKNKTIVLAHHNNTLIGFVSVVKLNMEGIVSHPVIHSGLTCILPSHRRSKGVLQGLFGNLFLHILMQHPEGAWTTTTADVISSLVQMSRYTTNSYPSPSRPPSLGPGAEHLAIAKEFSRKYRDVVNMSPDAEFDERNFVFMGSNNHEGAKAFLKDVDDRSHWHWDRNASEFYRALLKGKGDEVLLVGFLDKNVLKTILNEEGLREAWGERFAKL